MKKELNVKVKNISNATLFLVKSYAINVAILFAEEFTRVPMEATQLGYATHIWLTEKNVQCFS
nr:MAG TPA: hypothetical protein [Caudoviricetes sp.]